jgi:hypothetical protein
MVPWHGSILAMRPITQEELEELIEVMIPLGSTDILAFIRDLIDTSKKYGWTHQETLSILRHMPPDPNYLQRN